MESQSVYSVITKTIHASASNTSIEIHFYFADTIIMNTVDYLLNNRFSSLTLEERLEIKRLGRHRPEDLDIRFKGKSQNRRLQANNSCFDEQPWMTACLQRKALFCFPCILFATGGPGAWTKTGITDLGHLSDRVKSHARSPSHKTCCLQLQMLGRVNIARQLDDGYRAGIRRHNQKVDKNRHVLGKLIDCIKFCGAFELALRGHDEKDTSSNPGVFRGLVNFVAEIDNVMAEHLQSSRVFKGTSKTIQNELLDTMYEVYLEGVRKEVNESNFISIQADETTDVSCKSQMVIVLRYIVNGSINERFISFEEAKEKTANALTAIILNTLSKHSNLKNKVIAQTYDGAATMSGRVNGVQTQVKKEYPNAHFVHCYAHQLNLVMEQACSKQSRRCRIFFANLSAFPTFFSLSPKRHAAWSEYSSTSKRIPRPAQTRWNFNIRTVNVIYEYRGTLTRFFRRITYGDEEEEVEDQEGTRTNFEWDQKTIREACGLLKWLEDKEFLFMLKFFHSVMPHVDLLYNILQTRDISVNIVGDQLDAFIRSIEHARDNVDTISVSEDEDAEPPVQRRRRTDEGVKAACKEACDTILVQANDRFMVVGHLDALQLVNPKKFKDFNRAFPTEKLQLVTQFYGMIDVPQLRTELTLLYSREDFRQAKTSIGLYEFILQNNLQVTVFTEVHSLLEISLTTPLVSAESERCFSTLKRVKSFLRNSMTNQRLNALACLSIQKDWICEHLTFNNDVIDKFARSKTRRADFLYKTFDRADED